MPSVPETYDETFDFVDFVKTIEQKNYQGEWNIFFVRRDFSTDLMGFKDLRTGDTVCAENAPIVLESMVFPTPVIGLAVSLRCV